MKELGYCPKKSSNIMTRIWSKMVFIKFVHAIKASLRILRVERRISSLRILINKTGTIFIFFLSNNITSLVVSVHGLKNQQWKER
jgi:hypothetical protein